MAEELDQAERTEAASPRWIAQARQHGHWPRSAELTVAAAVLATVVVIRYAGAPVAAALVELTRSTLERASPGGISEHAIVAWRTEAGRLLPAVLLLVCPPMVVAVLAGLGQVGFRLPGAPLAPDLARLDPVRGLGRVFSGRGTVSALVTLLRWVFLCGLALVWLWRDLSAAAGALGETPDGLARRAAGLIVGAAVRVGVVLFVFGVLDYLRAWWSWQSGMRMSRSELRAELRESEGDPLLRLRRRQRQRERAEGRTARLLEPGDLLLVGKGRLAVVLRGQAGGALRVVAKGLGAAGERLERAARRSGVRIQRDDEPARAVYRRLRVGDELPAALRAGIGRRERRGAERTPARGRAA